MTVRQSKKLPKNKQRWFLSSNFRCSTRQLAYSRWHATLLRTKLLQFFACLTWAWNQCLSSASWTSWSSKTILAISTMFCLFMYRECIWCLNITCDPVTFDPQNVFYVFHVFYFCQRFFNFFKHAHWKFHRALRAALLKPQKLINRPRFRYVMKVARCRAAL